MIDLLTARLFVFRANVLNANQRAVVEEAMTCMPVTKPLSKPKSRRSGSSGGGCGGDGEGRGSGGESGSGKPRK